MHSSEQQVAIACAVRSVAQAFARLADVLDPAVSHAEGTTTSGLEELRAQLASDRDRRPHSRACGPRQHEHGSGCHPNCPTCGGCEPRAEQQDRRHHAAPLEHPEYGSAVDPTSLTQPCGCSPWAICDTHASIRPKGCTCHGPCYSSECPNPTHRAQAADTPDLDPSRVG